MNVYDLHPILAYALFLSNFRVLMRSQPQPTLLQILFRRKFEMLMNRPNSFRTNFLMASNLKIYFINLLRLKHSSKECFHCFQVTILVFLNQLRSLLKANHHNNCHQPIFFLDYWTRSVIFYDHLNYSLRNYLLFMNFIFVLS